jgi:hypothetical protein
LSSTKQPTTSASLPRRRSHDAGTEAGKQLRSFGLLVGGIFAIIGLWPTILRGDSPRLWALVPGIALIVPALLAPANLSPIYRRWMILANAMGWVNTRIVLGLIFFGLITPMGFIMRRFRDDPMRRRFDPDARTYRVPRQRRERTHLMHQF